MTEEIHYPDYRVAIGVTGASGSIYAERLIEILAPVVGRIYLMATSSGQQVVDHELSGPRSGFSLSKAIRNKGCSDLPSLRYFDNENLFAPIASGSAAPTHMIVVPCSMGTVGKLASGVSTNLLERSADVMLKQGLPLILCPRETPLSLIHLRNLTALAEAGARIMPAMPGFYNQPKTIDDLIDFFVGRILDYLKIDCEIVKRWNSRMI